MREVFIPVACRFPLLTPIRSESRTSSSSNTLRVAATESVPHSCSSPESSESSVSPLSPPPTEQQKSACRCCASPNSFMFQCENANFLTLSVSKRFLAFVLIRPCMLKLHSAAQEEGDTESVFIANSRSSSNSWRTARDFQYTSGIFQNL